jgi:hypothetical protein
LDTRALCKPAVLASSVGSDEVSIPKDAQPQVSR